jgi:hypothetical protein
MMSERKTWENMLARCYDAAHKSFPRYGGRGITVCDQWRDSFETFVRDMGRREPGMTLDRKDSDLPYSPDNCRWATRKAQANNRSNNKRVDIDGTTRTVAEWCERAGISQSVAHARIYRGWPGHFAVTIPVGSRYK